ncbi:sugar transferase [Roseibium sp. HPY-6]|uniref:sugar transferase n=1 Tax=Roseibium sp. HPY-6 TaxID=3229852 RepID=UPI00338FE455
MRRLANKTLRYAGDNQCRNIDKTNNIKLNSFHFGQDNAPQISRRVEARKPSVLKRFVDVVGAGTGLILLAPLLAMIAVAVKFTSRGPIIFRQERYGLNGERFTIFKFRTMHDHMCDGTGVSQTVSNDPRVTAVGNFLRRSNFDELPQLVNVLKGDMSLVGPRPHVPGMLAAGIAYEKFDSRYMDRHLARPGITGLAQVNGYRGETADALSARMRLEHDLAYLEKQSLTLDLKILARTFIREFFRGNGY